MITEMKPIFIKGDVVIRVGEQDHVCEKVGVSPFGITSIRWTAFDPSVHVGEKVHVKIKVLAKNAFRLETVGYITSEETKEAVYLGVRFTLAPQDTDLLRRVIESEGYYPTDYLRKYPRIPSSGALPDMPMRAIVRGDWGDELFVFDIGNISPGGVLLYTENQNAALFAPGSKAFIQVEPRGSLFTPFKCTGLVCRQVREKLPDVPNIRRYLGIKFVQTSAEDRETFRVMLQAVLEGLKKQGIK